MSTTTPATDGWDAVLTGAGLRDIDALLDPAFEPGALGGEWTALTKPGLGGRRRWRWRLTVANIESTIYVKRYARPPLKTQLDRWLRQTLLHSSAWWERRQADELAEAYFPVPTAIGAAETMLGPIERRSAVLIESAPGEAFDRAWRDLATCRAPLTRGVARADVAIRLGRFVSAFHQTGNCHRDLYLCHIFAEFDPTGAIPPTFCLIDLARTFRPRLRRMRWMLKDLSQLDYSACRCGASRVDRLRFLKAYLGLARGAPRIRWYATRITRRSAAIHRREIRKGRA